MKQSPEAPQRTGAGAYALVAGVLAAAAGLRWVLEPTLGEDLPLVLFILPVVVAALAGGLRLGLLTTAISCTVGAALFIPHSITAMDWLRIGLFLGAGTFVRWVVTATRLGWQRADETQRAGEERLRAEHERTVRILESIGDAFYALDADFRFTYVNRKAEQLWGKQREELLGRTLWDEFPQAVGSEGGEMHRNVMRELRPVQFETRSPILGTWLDVSLYPDTNGGLACYFRDISERKRSEEAVRAADQRKDEFLAVLGHELRNPLAPLRSGLELLEIGRDRPELIEEIRAMMARQLGHLVHLVDDLLDLSRITHGEIQLQQVTVDLEKVVAAAVELTRPFIAERGQHLSIAQLAEPVYVFGDFERLTQIVGNLLSNAAKYSPQNGTIEVRMQGAGEHALVSVRDTGFGIPAERLEEIFEMFTQVPEHRARLGGGGLGIGLALSRKLAELHGGTLEAADGLEKGSVFTLRLPLAEKFAQDVAEPVEPAEAPSPRRVLIVDDNADAADSLRLVLDLQGHETEVAYDPASALLAVVRAARHRPTRYRRLRDGEAHSSAVRRRPHAPDRCDGMGPAGRQATRTRRRFRRPPHEAGGIGGGLGTTG